MDMIRWFSDVESDHMADVGLDLATLIRLGRAVEGSGVIASPGFAVAAAAFRTLVIHNGLDDPIRDHVDDLESGFRSSSDVGAAIGGLLNAAELPPRLDDHLRAAYRRLTDTVGRPTTPVAIEPWIVSSGSPPEDGWRPTPLVARTEDELVSACRRSYASAFSDPTTSAGDRRFPGLADIALSVRPHIHPVCAGTCTSRDALAGRPAAITIVAVRGPWSPDLAESAASETFVVPRSLLTEPGVSPVVDHTSGSRERSSSDQSGAVDAALLSDPEVGRLALAALSIEREHRRPARLEWKKDAETGALVVARISSSRERTPAPAPARPRVRTAIAARGSVR